MNGIIKDLATISTLLGTSEKKVRAMVARQMLPYRKWGGRLIFLEQEIQEFLEQLPGVRVKLALKNIETRRGGAE